MNICKTEQEYISAIAPAVQRACKRYGYLPSVLIAQSCLENGYGIPSYWDNPQIALLLAANNMVGIKSELLNSTWDEYTVWQGESITKKTPEEYGGKMVIITDNFRKYDSIERSFCDFLLFLKYASADGKKPKYGDEVLNIKDPETLIKTVAGRGYATGSTYPSSVMRIINKHNLTKYDDLTNTKPTDITPGGNMLNIIDRTRYNTAPRSRGQNKIEFIVVHYLGVPNADNPDLYGGGYGGHFYVSRDGKVYKAADPAKAVVWHCGGGRQGSGGGSYFGVCTNFNSIGIECGVCYTENVRSADGDSNKWYFTTETQESLVKLVSYLMDKYGVPFEHVIRHFDVTGKICPNPYVKNNKLRTSWTWSEFRNKLSEYRGSKKDYLERGDNGDAVKEMQQLLITLGYSCGSSGADGDFGPATEKALKAFQKAQKLAVTGKYADADKTLLKNLVEAQSGWHATGTATARWRRTNIRKVPSVSAPVLMTLGLGNRFEIDGQRKGSWVHVNALGIIGWIHRTGVVYDKTGA